MKNVTSIFNSYFKLLYLLLFLLLLIVTYAKNVFCSVYVIGITCFDQCFLFYVITGRHYVFYKSLSLLWVVFQPLYVVAFFEATLLKEVRILRYPDNNSTILTTKFQNKVAIYFNIEISLTTYSFWLRFVTVLLY